MLTLHAARARRASSLKRTCRCLQWVCVLLAVATTSSMAVAAVGPAEAGRLAPPVVITLEDQTLSIAVDGVVDLAYLFAALADRIGADLVVRRDPGPIGPVRIERLAPGDAFRRLAGRHSLVLQYQGDRIFRVMLVAAREGPPAPPREVVAKAARTQVPALRAANSSEAEVRNQRAASLRDIVKLSYRHDDEAVAVLSEIMAKSSDSEVRGAAISALAGVGGAKATRLIATTGLIDRDPRIRLRAAQSLWLVGGATAGAQLRAAAGRETDTEIRVAIGRLLREGPPRGTGVRNGPHPDRPAR